MFYVAFKKNKQGTLVSCLEHVVVLLLWFWMWLWSDRSHVQLRFFRLLLTLRCEDLELFAIGDGVQLLYPGFGG